MTIVRAKVADEGAVLYFTTSQVEADQAATERRLYGSGLLKLWTPKMWANTVGLHIQGDDDDHIWTVYPLHVVQWMEEVRT